MNIIIELKEIVQTHSGKEIEGKLIDVQTANAIVTVYEALGEQNQNKFKEHSIEKMANIAWKLLQ